MAVVVGAEHDDRRADPGRAQLETLFDQRDRQRVAQRLERARDRHRAVAVGIGLDHPEIATARPDRLPNARQVPLHGAEIDLGDRGADGGADVDFGKRDAIPSAAVPPTLGWLAKPCKVSPALDAASILGRAFPNLGQRAERDRARSGGVSSTSRLLTSSERPRGVSSPCRTSSETVRDTVSRQAPIWLASSCCVGRLRISSPSGPAVPSCRPRATSRETTRSWTPDSASPVASCFERSSRATSSAPSASASSGVARRQVRIASRGMIRSVDASTASQSWASGVSGASAPSAIRSPGRKTSIEISRPFTARQTARILPAHHDDGGVEPSPLRRDVRAAPDGPQGRVLARAARSASAGARSELRARLERLQDGCVGRNGRPHQLTEESKSSVAGAMAMRASLGFGRFSIATAVPTPQASEIIRILSKRTTPPARRDVARTPHPP